MAGFTNKGKAGLLESLFNAAGAPATFNMGLATSAVAPVADTNTFGQLTQIATGNGYVDGGINLAKNSTDFDNILEDDTNDRGSIQIKDLVWTASSGPIPASGDGARYSALCDANVTVGSREVWNYFDLVSDRTVSDGQALTLQDCEMRLNES